MTRDYKPKKPKDPERPQRLTNAVKQVKAKWAAKKKVNLEATAREYNVSVGSLKYQLKGDKSRGIPPPKRVKNTGSPVKLGSHFEQKLAQWVRDMCHANLTPTLILVRRKAAKLAMALKIKFKQRLPPKEWTRAFLQRHNLITT
jgi:hypothetical protein